MKYCKLKRLNKLKNNCLKTIERVSTLAERIENSGHNFGECAYDEMLQNKQTIAFSQLDRLNKIINSL